MKTVELFKKEYGFFLEDFLGSDKELVDYIKNQAIMPYDFELELLNIDIAELSKQEPIKVRIYEWAYIIYKDDGCFVEIKSDDFEEKVYYKGKLLIS